MLIELVDGGNDFTELELREHGKSKTYWCQTGFPRYKRLCISRYLICNDGRVYGRIATELVPSGVHNHRVITIDDNSELAKSIKYKMEH